jgi:hypothetical protein
MEMKNKICQECGKKFHWCESCGRYYQYEQDYCSLDCYEKTFTYEKYKKDLMNIITKSKIDILQLKSLYEYCNENPKFDLGVFLCNNEVKEIWYKGIAHFIT